MGFNKTYSFIGTLGRTTNTNGVRRPNASQCPVISSPPHTRALIFTYLHYIFSLAHAHASELNHWDIGTDWGCSAFHWDGYRDVRDGATHRK